jgi:multidrug efflux pump subunit AcrA (membrane-fusion protein)
MNSTQKKRQKKHVMIRIAICSLILVVGWVGMNGLASLKQPPAEVKAEERPIRVQAMSAQPGDYPVAITGYGEARVLTVVTIAPEVAGRVVYTHPMLKVGQIIPAGEVMFRIDPADYEAGLQEASAGVAQWQNSVARLKKQFAIDSQRLKTWSEMRNWPKRNSKGFGNCSRSIVWGPDPEWIRRSGPITPPPTRRIRWPRR